MKVRWEYNDSNDVMWVMCHVFWHELKLVDYVLYIPKDEYIRSDIFVTNPGSAEKCSQRILANLHEICFEKKVWSKQMLAPLALGCGGVTALQWRGNLSDGRRIGTVDASGRVINCNQKWYNIVKCNRCTSKIAFQGAISGIRRLSSDVWCRVNRFFFTIVRLSPKRG